MYQADSNFIFKRVHITLPRVQAGTYNKHKTHVIKAKHISSICFKINDAIRKI